MKLQTLAVIFVIIMIPISLVISAYVGTQIDTVVLQTSYDTRLSNATYDAIKAYQINETNSTTQNIYSEKMRDIEASINIFYNSLATSFGYGGFGENELRPYIPAIVYTLYDGYYIYSPYENISNDNNIENGLKPYIYYSCHYQSGQIDIVVTYTLDNYITICGYNNSGTYVTGSGYLERGTANLYSTTLSEYNDEAYKPEDGKTLYKYYNGKKYYKDDTGWYEFTVDRRRNDIKDSAIISVLNSNAQRDNSAENYYTSSGKFYNNFIKTNGFDTLRLRDAKDLNSDSNDKIFELSAENDPNKANSIFSEHRRDVIKKSIETNLAAAIEGYNSISQTQGTTFNFEMPVINEVEWDKILNNVSMISFMQGLPIKNKYYMGYSVVTNNKNKEFVDPNSLFFIGSDGYYHKINCKNLVGASIGGAYRNIDFERKSLVVGDEKYYYFPQNEEACYDCIISSSGIDKTQEEALNTDSDKYRWYYTALARERYNSYKVNKFENY